MKYDHFIDAKGKGMCCSTPVTLLSKEFKHVKSGEVVLVVSDRVAMIKDIPAYCSLTKYELIRQEEKDGLLQFWIKKN